jgi:hypothetical protein
MTFLEFAEKILKEENKPLTTIEIWDIGSKKGYTKELRTKGATPWQTIGAQIYCDIRDNETSPFLKVEGKTIFYLKEFKDKVNLSIIENKKETEKENNLYEKDLHKYLVNYLYTNFKIFSKTISAQKSLKNSKNIDKWRHPDIVGVYFPNWEKEIVDISKDIGNFGMKISSYELKMEISNANLRETFFQAVSNSSWAYEGYLVAKNISDDDTFYDEFKRLNNSFGIGLIKLSTEDPSENKILFQAKQKEDIDIESMNILSKINNDFKEFIIDVKIDYTSQRIKGNYDKVISIEELYK